MAIEQRFTDLPGVTNSTLDDIICAVQGYISPLNLGLSTQQTLGQIYTLFQNNVILYNAGNPNSAVAGSTYQFCWDTVDLMLWICTTTGTASTAVWTKVIQLTAGSGIGISQSGSTITISASAVAGSFIVVTGTTQTMAVDTTYQANNAGRVTFTLPTTATLGQFVNVTGFGAGGWTIVQNSGQNIQIGNVSSTPTSGSVSSTNQYDGLSLVCTVANTTFQAITAPQGNLTIV